MTLTNGQWVAIIRGLALAALLGLTLIPASAAMYQQPRAATWFTLGAAFALMVVLAGWVISLDWRGLSLVQCPRCSKRHNVNAAVCGFCGLDR